MLTASFGLFLLSAIGISLSGVIAPGPLTAATITKGYNDKYAGTFIALGHAIVELPLMALIYFGFAHFLASPEVKRIIGVIGGLLLIFMGAMLFRTMNKAISEAGSDLPSTSFTTGIILTGANPYFLLWWATIGIALVYGAAEFGVYGLIIFVVVHWLCDLSWEQLVSFTVFKTRNLWTPKVQKVVFGICSLVLIGFGIWFCVSVFS
jgi:threonine/homoserine/homoserine lactone efflux protein